MSSEIEPPPPGGVVSAAEVHADLTAIRHRIHVMAAALAMLYGQLDQLRRDIDEHRTTRLHNADS